MTQHTVASYMSKSVNTVTKDMTLQETSDKIKETGHDGFPVCSNGKLVGYIRARDIIMEEDKSKRVSEVMDDEYLVFDSSVSIKTAGRIMFREGNSEIPVVDEDNRLVGIITNTDVVRSQIERTTPRKVDSLASMLSNIYEDITIEEFRSEVNIDGLIPTQTKIYKDELNGRKYELKKGLAEPIVVVKTPSSKAIADGHHRAVAASRLDSDSIKSYVIEIQDDIDLGMVKNAKENGLNTLEDVRVIRTEDHPTIEKVKLISEL